ncbi:MAG: sigma-54-dependent Fis family transcriptional regulator [Proteobacteria bacterium]|nr:sigma-54-dependent Fis family transcriptional regulator [Pseudomonadota bacterium]
MRAEDIQPLDTLHIDPSTGYPMWGAHRIALSQARDLLRVRQDMIHCMGEAQASILQARGGFEAGLGQAAAMAELYDFDSPEECLKASEVVIRMHGLADMSFERLDLENKRLRFSGRWRDSMIARAWLAEHGPSLEPVCAHLAGMLSGYASAAIGSEVLVKETACQGCGDPACLFEGRTLGEWGLTKEEAPLFGEVESLAEMIAGLRADVKRAGEDIARQKAELERLRRSAYRPDEDEGIIYRSETMARVLMLAGKVAPTGSTVLIQGESGTGKELLARFLHRRSGRSEEPFLAINCAALPPNLLESELFGHVKGAFTGADRDKKGLFVEAGRGTLFLDEVGELPLELQAKLLRAIQEKEVRPVGGVRDFPVEARILAASNQDLKSLASSGRFRDDLYYRLSVFPIHVGPLRERREDILPLARHFLGRFRSDPLGFAPDTVRTLEAYPWPGNVRELENWVEYAVIMAGPELIIPDHLPQAARDPIYELASDFPTRDELERRYIRLVLEHTRGNRSEAARILGLSTITLWRRLKSEESPDESS